MYEDETLENILGLEPENSRDAPLQNEEGSEVDFEDSHNETDSYDENENGEDMRQSKRGTLLNNFVLYGQRKSYFKRNYHSHYYRLKYGFLFNSAKY